MRAEKVVEKVVRFEKGRDGAVLAWVDGKVSFPVRGWNPQVGELWVVRVAGENPRGTVYFLEPVRKLEGWKLVPVPTTWRRPPSVALPVEDGARYREYGTGVKLWAVPEDLGPSEETIAKAKDIAEALTGRDGREYRLRTYELDDSVYIYSPGGSVAAYVTACGEVVWMYSKPLEAAREAV